MPQSGVLHVRIDAVQFDGFSIQIKNLMANFGLLKTNAPRNDFFGFTLTVDELQR